MSYFILYAQKILLELCDCHFGEFYFETNFGELFRPCDKEQEHKFQTGLFAP